MTLLSLFPNSNQTTSQILLFGEDNFLNEYLAYSYAQEVQFKELERLTIDCEQDGLNELIAALTEASLFSQSKIILVKNPFFLTAKVPAKYQKQVEQLQTIFANLDQLSDVIILMASYAKLDRRKKLTKTVLQQFNLVQTTVKSYEVAKYTQGIIQNEGYQITNKALQLLLERSDQVLDTVLSNYAKLKMVAKNCDINKKIVQQNVDLSLAQNVFAILEAALKHHYPEAIARLENQLQNGSNPIQLLAVFENQLELLVTTKTLQQRGRSESQIVKELGVHPYRVKLALHNELPLAKLAALLEQAILLDYHYKAGDYRDINWLKLFILRV